MSAFRFDCIFCYVSDLDRAIQFYATVLGFRLSSRDAVAHFDLNGVHAVVPPSQNEGHANGVWRDTRWPPSPITRRNASFMMCSECSNQRSSMIMGAVPPFAEVMETVSALEKRLNEPY